MREMIKHNLMISESDGHVKINYLDSHDIQFTKVNKETIDM